MIVENSFEATCPRHDFAPLVRIGVAIAAMISRARRANESDISKDRAGGGATGLAA